MNKLAINARPPAQVSLSEELALAKQYGLTAGWTGAINDRETFAAYILARLRLRKREESPEFESEPSAILEQLHEIGESIKKLDALRLDYESAMEAVPTKSESADWLLTARRVAVVIVLLLLTVTLLNMAHPSTPWQIYAALALLGVLIVVLPRGLAGALRSAFWSVKPHFSYLAQRWRLLRLQLRENALKERYNQELFRRESGERLLTDSLAFITAHYDIHHGRGASARLISDQTKLTIGEGK